MDVLLDGLFEAVRLLLTVVRERVAENGAATPDHRRLETRLVIRGSSGPVRPPR